MREFFRQNWKSMWRYLLVGLCVYAIEYGVYVGLIFIEWLTPIVANTTAKIIAGLAGYFLHRLYTFGKPFLDGLLADFGKYVAILLINVPLFAGVFYLVSLVTTNLILIKVVADIFCVLIAYLQTRFLVFRYVRT
jgi:putative flippase GtrA